MQMKGHNYITIRATRKTYWLNDSGKYCWYSLAESLEWGRGKVCDWAEDRRPQVVQMHWRHRAHQLFLGMARRNRTHDPNCNLPVQVWYSIFKQYSDSAFEKSITSRYHGKSIGKLLGYVLSKGCQKEPERLLQVLQPEKKIQKDLLPLVNDPGKLVTTDKKKAELLNFLHWSSLKTSCHTVLKHSIW